MTDSTAQTLSPAQLESTYRSNFLLFLVDGILFTIAMGIIGTTTVIPDFIRQLTDSEVLIGLSSSLFEVGWMMPQLFMARYLLQFSRKKWWFAGPNIPVRFAILAFSGILIVLGEEQPGPVLVAFLVCYGIAAVGDGIVGVPWVELIGSSLDNRWRARMFGLMMGIGGLITLGVTPLVGVILGEDGPGFPNNYGLLFAIAGLLFVGSIIPCLFIRELPNRPTTVKAPRFREYLPALGRVLRQDRAFRAMIITRALSSLYMMAGPFYIGFATVQLGVVSGVAVRNLLAMQTLGALLGAFVYSWMGNRHNLQFIRLALVAAALLPVSALVAGAVGPLPLYLGFFASGIALSNLFSSYLNWVIMHTTPDQRPVYTGLFNTVSAISLLSAPLIGGTIAEVAGYEVLFVTALVMVVGALFVVLRYIKAPAEASPEAPAAG